MINSRSIVFLVLLLLINISKLAAQKSNKKEEIPLSGFVGYYNVGTKPNKPFFKSRWYLREGKLFVIYDSDVDRELQLLIEGKHNPSIIYGDEDIAIEKNDTTYYLQLHFKDQKLEKFRVFRPRQDWSTDLYGYRNNKLSDLATDTEKSLTYQHETENFKFYSAPKDEAYVLLMAESLENKFEELTKAFGIKAIKKTAIRIYPDLDTYHNAVLTPGAPSWQMGRAWTKNEVRMLSPKEASKISQEEVNVQEIVLHEFVHCLHMHLIKDGMRVPGWLWEGVAIYKGCCLWNSKPFNLEYIKNHRYPTLKQIERDQTFQIKYELGYFLIEFIEQNYGWTGVLKLIETNGDIRAAFQQSNKQFEKEFYLFLAKNYQE